jgi:hypothetical protein
LGEDIQLSPILDPHFPIGLKDASSIFLPVGSALLGLVFAGLIFWLQGGFAGLEYTSDILRPLILTAGKVVLDLLVATTAVALFGIFGLHVLISLGFWLFAFIFTKDVLRQMAAQGLIITIFSTKFIPAGYGPRRKFWRQIRNAGASNWIGRGVLIGVCIVYPEVISLASGNGLWLTDAAAEVFMVVATVVALLQTRSLLVEGFAAREQLERREQPKDEHAAMTMNEDEQPVWSANQRNLEHKVIEKTLQGVGLQPWTEITQLRENEEWSGRDLTDKPVLSGPFMLSEHGDLHINLQIPYFNSDAETRAFIFHWSRITLEALAVAPTKVTHYAMSYWRRDGGPIGPASHFGMVRASRSDVMKALEGQPNDETFVRNLPGRYLSSHIAEY